MAAIFFIVFPGAEVLATRLRANLHEKGHQVTELDAVAAVESSLSRENPCDYLRSAGLAKQSVLVIASRHNDLRAIDAVVTCATLAGANVEVRGVSELAEMPTNLGQSAVAVVDGAGCGPEPPGTQPKWEQPLGGPGARSRGVHVKCQ